MHSYCCSAGTIHQNGSARDQNGSARSSSAAAASSREAQTEKFQWLTAWYPVFAVDDLDPAKPHAVQLLGRRLVVWRDASKTWQCFEDLCPHRYESSSELESSCDMRSDQPVSFACICQLMAALSQWMQVA